MVWGDWCADGSDCATVPQAIAASGASMLLGFNEPDWVEQANMTVERALELWAYLDRTPLRLGSPAVTLGPRGAAWLEAFMSGAQARGLRVDFIAAHWYGDCSSTAGLRSYLTELGRYGRPVWLTEFDCKGLDAVSNERFLRSAMGELQQMTAVERVAWFSNRSYPGYEDAALLTASGELTAVGRAYAATPAWRVPPG
jgi:hypothetical protein